MSLQAENRSAFLRLTRLVNSIPQVSRFDARRASRFLWIRGRDGTLRCGGATWRTALRSHNGLSVAFVRSSVAIFALFGSGQAVRSPP